MVSMRVAAVPAEQHEPLAEEEEQLLDVDTTSTPLRRRLRQAAFGALALTAACVLLGATLPDLHINGLTKAKSPEKLAVSKRYIQELTEKVESRSAQSGSLLNKTMQLAKLRHLPPSPVDERLLNNGKSADRRWQEGLCFINVWIALEKLALIGMTIDSAVIDCDDKDKKTACAADIAGIYASVSAAGGYLDGIAGTCPSSVKNNASISCVQGIFTINYGVGTLASAFATVADICSPEHVDKKIPAKEVPHHLQGITKAVEHKRSNSIGMCVINVNQAASYIGRATIAIRDATKKCKDQSIDKPGRVAAKCAVQVSAVIQSFALIEAYLANAATQCGETAIVAAGCANRIGAIVAGMVEISGGAATAADQCDPPTTTTTTAAAR
eukprot:TRINITY_DN8045_c0_g1_i2.p1 TRINITY_DN8045_c0_g1~~TRINITY_DN8045_c0_g1_i2.p1  ORF type:complete len:384 (-),score=75.38 TRINITY_DN8045_c0_g1_i2:155-1306(-)